MRNDPGIRLDGGFVVPSGLTGRRHRLFGRLKIAHRLWSMVGLSALLFVAAVAIGWLGLKDASQALENVYKDRAEPMYILSRFNSLMKENYAEVLRGFQHSPEGAYASLHDHPISLHTNAVSKRRGELDALWQQFLSASHDEEEEKRLIADFAAKRQAWTDKLGSTLAALDAGDYSFGTLSLFLKAGREEGAAAEDAMNKLINYQAQVAKALYEKAEAVYKFDQIFLPRCWCSAYPAC